MPARRNRPTVTARPSMPRVGTNEEVARELGEEVKPEEKPEEKPEDSHGEPLTDAAIRALEVPRTPEITNDVHPAETAQSATVDLARCETMSGKEGDPRRRRCQLNAGHEGDHRYRTSGAAAITKPLKEVLGADADLSAMFDDVPDDEVVQVKETVRDELQKAIDAKVLESYEAWVAKGKPAGFNDSPRKRWIGAPDAAPAIRKALTNAGNFHKKHVKIAPNKTHESGRTMIYFVATDRRERKPATTQVPATDTNEPKPDTE